MPELPDIQLYVEALRAYTQGKPILKARLHSPFLVRTYDPPFSAVNGRTVREVRRMGKRIVLGLDEGIFMVFHLMIAGRLVWKVKGERVARRPGMADFEFPNGRLVFTEAGTKKRASLHIVRGEAGLKQFERGGVEPLETDLEGFRAALTRGNHTLKRALTSPALFSGIGNAYSDEILHRARLSPMKLTSKVTPEESKRLFEAARQVLTEWTERLRKQSHGLFPEKVTAFRPEMAVHGRFGEPCPVCKSPVQRIVYAENEANYCARCQTGGKLLADRAMSRLLKSDWPKTIDEIET